MSPFFFRTVPAVALAMLVSAATSCRSPVKDPPETRCVRLMGEFEERLSGFRQPLVAGARDLLPRFPLTLEQLEKSHPDLTGLRERLVAEISAFLSGGAGPGRGRRALWEGERLRLEGDWRGAKEKLGGVEKGRDGHPEARLALARMERDLGSLRWAEHHALVAVGEAPDLAPAHLLRGELALYRGDAEGALGHFERAAAPGVGSASVQTGLGLALLAMGEHERAEAAFAAAVRLDPRYLAARNNRGVVRRLRGDAAGALEDFEKALAIDSTCIPALLNRGAVLEQEGRREEAISDYTHALDVRSDSPHAFFNRGFAMRAEGRLEIAELDFTEAIRLEPRFAQAYLWRGAVRDDQGNLEGAVADFTEAFRLDPDHADALYRRAVARYQKKEIDRALEDLDACLRKDPASLAARVARGMVRRDAGDKAGAVADFEEALRVAPEDWPSRPAVREMLRQVRGD